jgi:hypothetical protein
MNSPVIHQLMVQLLHEDNDNFTVKERIIVFRFKVPSQKLPFDSIKTKQGDLTLDEYTQLFRDCVDEFATHISH